MSTWHGVAGTVYLGIETVSSWSILFGQNPYLIVERSKLESS